MPCMCGDSECPSCGLAQGTLDESEMLRAEIERLNRTLSDARMDAVAWRLQYEQLAGDRAKWMRDSNAEAAALVENAESLHAKAIDQLTDVTGERDLALAEVERLKRELSEARRAALEEAAGIVEQAALHERLKPRRNEVVEIAAAIRAAAKEER